MAIELRLNTQKVGNYAFFCPVTRLHLTLTNPIGFVDGVSPYIIRGIKGGSIIDVNNVVNLEESTTKLKRRKSKDTEVAVEEKPAKKQDKTEEVIPKQNESISSEVQEAVVNPVIDPKNETVETSIAKEPTEEKVESVKTESETEVKEEVKEEETVEDKKVVKAKTASKKTATKRTTKKTS